MFESIFTSTADNSINISQAAISLGASIESELLLQLYICTSAKKKVTRRIL